MIVFVDTKTKKVDLTKEQLQSLLKEEYDRGYEEGKKKSASYTYYCPYHSWGCPYWSNTITTTPTITWTSTNTDTTGTIFCGDTNTTLNSSLDTVKE